MLPEEKRNTNLGVGGGLILMFASRMITKAAPDLALVGLLIGIVGWVVFIWGCAAYARGKGYSWAWGLLGLLSILGLIILFFFPDRHKTPSATTAT